MYSPPPPYYLLPPRPHHDRPGGGGGSRWTGMIKSSRLPAPRSPGTETRSPAAPPGGGLLECLLGQAGVLWGGGSLHSPILSSRTFYLPPFSICLQYLIFSLFIFSFCFTSPILLFFPNVSSLSKFLFYFIYLRLFIYVLLSNFLYFLIFYDTDSLFITPLFCLQFYSVFIPQAFMFLLFISFFLILPLILFSMRIQCLIFFSSFSSPFILFLSLHPSSPPSL